MIYRDKHERKALKQRVYESEEEQVILWACCFFQKDPLGRILRDIPPVEVVVTLEKDPTLYRSAAHQLIVRPYVPGGRRQLKMLVKTQEDNADLVLMDTHQEAVEFYNQALMDHYATFSFQKQKIDHALQHLAILKIKQDKEET